MSDAGPLRFLSGFRGRALLGGFLLLLFLLLLVRWGVTLYVDALWFASEGAGDVFRTRLFWEWGGRVGTGLLVGLLTWLSLRVVLRTFAGIQVRRRVGDLVIQEQLPENYIRWSVIAACVLIGLWFAAAVPQGTGIRALLLLNAPEWGRVDPIFGRDLSFYLFHLPVMEGLLTFALVVVVFLAAVVAAGYSATGAIEWGGGQIRVKELPRRHLIGLAVVFLLLLAVRFHLAPYGLIQDGSSGVQGIFGYADEHARLPAYRFLTFMSLAAAGVVAWAGVRRRLGWGVVAVGGLAIAVLGAGQIFPAVVQRFQVEPNELERETPYIEMAVEHTREGFGLSGMTRELLPYQSPSASDWEEIPGRLERLPVWTEATLLATFRQIEARFEYYDFHRVVFDRYPVGGRAEPVAVSVREINPDRIPDPSWQNRHLRERFISGMGAVAGQLHRQDENGRLPLFLTAIPPEFREIPGAPPDVAMTRPQVYVGSRPQHHAVINPGEDSFLAPDGTMGEPGVDFPEGILMGSILRTAALAWSFRDANLLLASEVGPTSRFVFRRQVRERVRTLAPFLLLPEDPYPVVSDGRVVWILEGFTVSRSFPLSTAHQVDERSSARYIRNSVKTTVDAVTGQVRLYAADPDDPLLRAYRGAFPTLFRDLEEMPGAVSRHLRYSRHLMDVQSNVLLRYHQEAPPVFHGQQDRWAVATELSVGTQVVPYRPEYAFLTLPSEEEESYVLSTLFVPQGRDNLASFFAARWSPETGSELHLWDVPVESQVRGPRQIEALVEQDPEISQQFSLWRQGGSQVWTGHLHLVPVGNTLVYMEPVFLAADREAIPEIRRYVVSDGRRVVMHPTLNGAVSALAMGFEGLVDDEGVEAMDPAEARPAAEEMLRELEARGAGEALHVLEEAEERLRQGDWEGFGRKLEELRELLRRSAEGD
jgi:uncharacterized protein